MYEFRFLVFVVVLLLCYHLNAGAFFSTTMFTVLLVATVTTLLAAPVRAGTQCLPLTDGSMRCFDDNSFTSTSILTHVLVVAATYLVFYLYQTYLQNTNVHTVQLRNINENLLRFRNEQEQNINEGASRVDKLETKVHNTELHSIENFNFSRALFQYFNEKENGALVRMVQQNRQQSQQNSQQQNQQNSQQQRGRMSQLQRNPPREVAEKKVTKSPANNVKVNEDTNRMVAEKYLNKKMDPPPQDTTVQTNTSQDSSANTKSEPASKKSN